MLTSEETLSADSSNATNCRLLAEEVWFEPTTTRIAALEMTRDPDPTPRASGSGSLRRLAIQLCFLNLMAVVLS